MLGKNLTLKGYLHGEIANDDVVLERAKGFIMKGLASGQLKPLIAPTFSLDLIQEAAPSGIRAPEGSEIVSFVTCA